MDRLIPCDDNYKEPNGTIGKQNCGIVFWQKTGFLRHCNQLGLQSIMTLVNKKYHPSDLKYFENAYYITFDNDENKIIYVTLHKERKSNRHFIYGESHTAYANAEFHIFSLGIVNYIAQQIGTEFYVNDATGYVVHGSHEELKKYIDDFRLSM